MSFRRNTIGARSSSVNRQQSFRLNSFDADVGSAKRIDSLPNVLPELTKIVRKLLPYEIPFNVHVRDVEYKENGCESSNGTLYLTSFRLVFAPDNEYTDNHFVFSQNKYIGEHDIPLTSICKIDVAPVNTRSGFKSFLNENQIQSETSGFSIVTRDFRHLNFSKFLITQSNTNSNKPHTSASKMEIYINALIVHSRFQDKEQLYPYLAIQKPMMHQRSSRMPHGHSTSTMTPSPIDDLTDFSISHDERIRGFMFSSDWEYELKDAEEIRWVIDDSKFDGRSVIKTDGPYICLTNCAVDDDSANMIWHWTHKSEAEVAQGHQKARKLTKFMLVTVPGIGEAFTLADPLRRNATDTSLLYTLHSINQLSFNRYNLSKFPCSLKRLQASYEKLIDLCAIAPEDEDGNDDDKWLSKLHGCKWLKIISKTLRGATSLARLLNYTNVQFVGSDIDNSCLMSSLIQVLLRPRCRTIKGFCELIVREWIIRGHPFRERFGQVVVDANGNSAQEAPVFLLFLDCVHQLINQNPFAFEFTEYFLIQLYYSVCYCYHHTFVFNSMTERLTAMRRCPTDILVLSSFDFSLYLNSNIHHLLKNHASNINSKTIPSSPRLLKSDASRKGNKTPLQMRSNRPAYRLESPRPERFVLDVSSTNEALPVTFDQFEYDLIEAPQKFHTDLYVDWRLFNLVLWSKCYCRYDPNFMPTLREQQLFYELSCREEDIQKIHTKSRRRSIDPLHPIHHANSWHPMVLNTHF